MTGKEILNECRKYKCLECPIKEKCEFLCGMIQDLKDNDTDIDIAYYLEY